MDLLEILAFLAILAIILIVAQILKSDHTISTGTQNTDKGPHFAEIEVVFSNVVDFLKSDEVYFRYGKNKKEKDYQHDLDQKLDMLKYKYGYEKNYEGYLKKHRVDFIINNNIGIEMKVYRGGIQVKQELFYQISEYVKSCKKMVALVINVTHEEDNQIKNDIEQKLEEVIKANVLEVIVKSPENLP
jgi:hypothetical protein